MLRRLQHLWLGLALIGLASGILLWSDLDRRQKNVSSETHPPRVALFQFASTPLLDDAVHGVIEGLAEAGFVNSRNMELECFNSSGDYTMANAIAGNIVSGNFDQIITISTPALQVMAAANRDGKTPHVFGAVTNPYGSGVGISGKAPNQHPAHLVGIGTFQPVTRLFAIAQELCPSLRRVGVVWSPTEQNSEACVQLARAACLEQHIELLEANAGNSSEVSEAVRALLARNVEAIWIGGDTVACASISAIVSAAKASKVPVFTNDPSDVARGALFSLGASYPEVGRRVAALSAMLLKGTEAKTIGIENVVPERFAINKDLLSVHADKWKLTKALQQRSADSTTQTAHAPWQLRIVSYNDTSMSEECLQGLKDGLLKGGLVEGRDYAQQTLNAQGDMATLSSIMASVRAAQPDLLLTITTPALQAALRQAGDTRIVFTGVADGVQAGAGKSEAVHLPNVTGITTNSPFQGMASMLREIWPGARRVGTLFTPSEINSVFYKDEFAAALKEKGIELVSLPVNSSAETSEAAAMLCRNTLDAVCQISDNTTRPGFGLIARRANDAGIPAFSFESSQIKQGAALALARDFYQAGLEAGALAVRVLKGESPAGIPFSNTHSETLTVNPAAAARLGLKLPESVLRRATIFESKSANVPKSGDKPSP